MRWTRKMMVSIPTGWVEEAYETPSGHTGTTRKRQYEERTHTVEFAIDMERLCRSMAYSAVRNRTKKTKAMSGIVTARVVKAA